MRAAAEMASERTIRRPRVALTRVGLALVILAALAAALVSGGLVLMFVTHPDVVATAVEHRELTGLVKMIAGLLVSAVVRVAHYL